jgi:hypothetical protein
MFPLTALLILKKKRLVLLRWMKKRKAEKTRKQEKKKRLGIQRKKDDDELALLDTQIISKELIEQASRSNNVVRFEPSTEHGLNEDQVEQRIKEGLVNDNQKQYSKTYKQIFFNNIFKSFRRKI